MPNTRASIHHVVFDARRRRFKGAVVIGDAPEFSVSVPGHPSWGYRKIARAMVTASESRMKQAKGTSHDHS